MYTPLPKLPRPEQQAELPGQPVYWGVEPASPYYELHEISLNITTASLALRFAGLGALVLREGATAPVEEKKTDDSPRISGISGISGGGVGIARGSASSQQGGSYSVTNLDVPEDQKRRLPNRQKPILHAAINMGVVANRVAKRDQGISATEALAIALDAEMRGAIVKGAKEKLTQPHELPVAPIMALCVALEVATVTAGIVKRDPVLLGLALALYTGGLSLDVLTSKLMTGSFDLKGRQWSLSPFVSMPDRYLATKGLAKNLTFVKYRPNKKTT